jgi:hypothetical protein
VATQSLASHESLALDSSQCVEGGCDKQNDGSNDKAGCLDGDRDPLDDTHGQVDGGAHVIGLESADECIKRGRRRADAQEERDFDKEDDERADTGCCVSTVFLKHLTATYRHITANRMTQWKRKMLPMPRPKHSTMLMIPALLHRVSACDCRRWRVVDPTIDRIYLFASQRVVPQAT